MPQLLLPSYPLNGRLGDPEGQSGYSGEENNFLPMLVLLTWIIQPVV